MAESCPWYSRSAGALAQANGASCHQGSDTTANLTYPRSQSHSARYAAGGYGLLTVDHLQYVDEYAQHGRGRPRAMCRRRQHAALQLVTPGSQLSK
jgi:hypothetical protein